MFCFHKQPALSLARAASKDFAINGKWGHIAAGNMTTFGLMRA